ncbi:MAG: HlyU family transcriptional regulator [Motiliproteus sp.]|nr:HlyU family transcriptional regulator [Motiliproteus sp.]MCW9051637.1 HlyU family transcriptional regulator [Motiliproteus sp.]
MSFFDSFKSLFSGSGESAHPVEPVEYKGYSIAPAPREEEGQYRIAAVISKDDREHQFIRCDLVMSFDECVEVTLYKAKMTIDQQGDAIFS